VLVPKRTDHDTVGKVRYREIKPMPVIEEYKPDNMPIDKAIPFSFMGDTVIMKLR